MRPGGSSPIAVVERERRGGDRVVVSDAMALSRLAIDGGNNVARVMRDFAGEASFLDPAESRANWVGKKLRDHDALILEGGEGMPEAAPRLAWVAAPFRMSGRSSAQALVRALNPHIVLAMTS